jgi:hypothetical protein
VAAELEGIGEEVADDLLETSPVPTADDAGSSLDEEG